VKPDRGAPLSVIAAMLGSVLLASGILWAVGLWRRGQELRRLRDVERRAELARAELLDTITQELRREDTEAAIHRRLIAQASLVVEHDESDLVVFHRGPLPVRTPNGRAPGGLGIEASPLEQRVAETGDAAHRTTVERGQACYQVAVPVRTTDGLLAVLTLRRALGSFTVAELDAAMALCSQVGAALERTRRSMPEGRGTPLLS
jgi:GAF domain-containing protein